MSILTKIGFLKDITYFRGIGSPFNKSYSILVNLNIVKRKKIMYINIIINVD